MKKNTILTLALVFLSFLFPVQSEEIFQISTENLNHPLNSYIYYLEDKNLSIDDILSSPVNEWKQNGNKVLSFGFTNSVYWIKVTIENVKIKEDDWILELSYPPLDSIEFYYKDQNNQIQKINTGDFKPFYERDFKHRNYIFNVIIPENAKASFYFKIATNGTFQVPLEIKSNKNFLESMYNEQFVFGLYYGIIFIMILYNLFLFVSMRDTAYLFYVFYVGSFALFQMSQNGLAYQYLWPSFTWWASNCIIFFVSTSNLFLSAFCIKFMILKEKVPRAFTFYKFIIFISIVLALYSFFGSYSIGLRISALLTLVTSVSSLTLSFISMRRGFKPAKYFLLAFIVFLNGAILFALTRFGLLPSMFITEYSVQIGSALEVLLLSFALADKINLLRIEKEKAQTDTIDIQKKLVNSYARFVPEQLLSFLGKNIITEIHLGDTIQKDMTILFSDIRQFTTMSEGMSPDENFGFINSYMAIMGPCIRKYNGFIDKYIGDAIMALFPEKTSDAIDASIEMLDELHTLNVKRKERGFPPISIGIGIHTGNQMLGIIGEKERLEGTVISDVVNTASRLESLTKVYSCSLLISEDVMDKVENKNKYFHRIIDTVKVKGKNKAVRILEILNGNSQRIIDLKQKTLPDFQQGIELYIHQNFKKAKSYFEKVITLDPKDKAAERYILKCDFYLKNGVGPDWDGIEKLDFK